nr:hypothetical protein [Vibrio cholerae]
MLSNPQSPTKKKCGYMDSKLPTYPHSKSLVFYFLLFG